MVYRFALERTLLLNSAGIAHKIIVTIYSPSSTARTLWVTLTKTGLYQTLFGAIVGTDDHLHCIAILIYVFNYVCC